MPTEMLASLIVNVLWVGLWSIFRKATYVSYLHPIFRFWFWITFGNKVTKIKKLHILSLHFARQDGQERKKK